MSSAPVLDERAHRDVLVPLLEATVGADRVFDYGGVPGRDSNPGVTPPIFVLLTVERRYVAPMRAGVAGRSGWRVTCRYVGRTVDEARWAGVRVTEALDEKRLQIAGHESGPVTHETTNAVSPDDGRQSGLVSYTYAL